MSLIEQLDEIERRMEQSLELKRFDTFKMLLSERLMLLKKARHEQGNEDFFMTARKRTSDWIDLIDNRIKESRKEQQRASSMGGYGSGATIRPGRVINRIL